MKIRVCLLPFRIEFIQKALCVIKTVILRSKLIHRDNIIMKCFECFECCFAVRCWCILGLCVLAAFEILSCLLSVVSEPSDEVLDCTKVVVAKHCQVAGDSKVVATKHKQFFDLVPAAKVHLECKEGRTVITVWIK